MTNKHKFIPRDKFLKTLSKKRIVAGAFLFNKIGQLLIIKPSYKDHWSIPGGIVDAKESPLESCLREVEEEVGLKFKNIKLIGCVYIYDKKYKDESIQLYFFKDKLPQKQVKSIKINDDEIIDFKFVDPNNLSDLSKKLRRRVKTFLKSKNDSLPFYIEEYP